MKISGFSYVRGGFDYEVPFLESILSVLPACDEFIIAVGDSNDGTREAIEGLNSPKIRIIDTIWDMTNNEKGKIFAEQSNLALDSTTGDWAFHIQADEVIHENDLPKILDTVHRVNDNKNIDGILLPFLHFTGDYHHIRTSRRIHRNEIRLFKNGLGARAYKDSQGFRKYKSLEGYKSGSEKGEKLRVVKVDAPIYHYTRVRRPENNIKKTQALGYFYQDENVGGKQRKYDPMTGYDRLEKFTGSHPEVMREKIEGQDWDFEFDPAKAVWRKKDKLIQPIEDFLGIRIGEYKNYILVKE